MGVKKGTDNFAQSRAKEVSDNLALIKHELDKQKKRRIPYPDLRALVADISEKTGLHRTTLTREGSKYLRTLLSHLAHQPGASALMSDKDAPPEILREKLYDARLEIRTLKNRLAVLERRFDADGNPPPPTRQLNNSKNIAPASDWYFAFTDTAMLFKLLVDRMNSIDETVRIDVESKQILDLSAPSNERVVAGPERARWFVEYYKKLNEQEKSSAGVSK